MVGKICDSVSSQVNKIFSIGRPVILTYFDAKIVHIQPLSGQSYLLRNLKGVGWSLTLKALPNTVGNIHIVKSGRA